jgi:serine/threonine-protein kinase
LEDALGPGDRTTLRAVVGTQVHERGNPAPVVAEPVRRSVSSGIPTYLLDQASSRLALFASVIAGATAFSVLAEHANAWIFGWPLPPGFDRARWVRLGLSGLSLIMAAVARSRKLHPGTLLSLALVYEVVGGGLGAWEHWYLGALFPQVMSITWLCVFIVMFPLLVPAPPLRCGIAAFATASTPLLVLAVAAARGDELPKPQSLHFGILPNYLAAVLSIVPATLIYRLQSSLGRAEQEARDLGSYKLVKPLGKGGMGEVWQAEHRMLARPAAIKLISADLFRDVEPRIREAARARFEQEARVTAHLHSPHTVGLYDFGVTSDGTFYYVMELLTGLDLHSLVERFGAISPARTVHLLTQACRSLAEAHHAGLVHRDIKPANIYLCRVGLEHDFVKVLDFGLVKRTDRNPAEVGVTAENAILGTPTYMPPEMAEGRPDVDARADIYALGCVGYWLLTGTPVFNTPGRTRMQVLMDHVGARPEPPSQRLGKKLPEQLEALLLQTLEKDPKKRPQSAIELGERLAACQLDGSWTEADARRWWSDNLKEDAVPSTLPGLATTLVRPRESAPAV